MKILQSYSSVFLFTVLVFFIAATAYCQPNKKILHSEEDKLIEKKIDLLLRKMTIEEKVWQMTQYAGDGAITGPVKVQKNLVDDLKKGYVGSMLNVIEAQNTLEVQKLVMENSRMKIPLIFGLDVIHGFKTIFPIPLGEAASWDLEAIELSARVAAIEASEAGINWTFAPMIDIARDPRWGRIMEGAGEDPYHGSLVAKARIAGFQGKNLKDKESIVACAKHFAAYGAAIGGRDYNTIDISDRTLHEIYLPAFKAAVEAGVGTFMSGFNELNGFPTTGNSYLIKDILRKQWGFKGFVVSDMYSVGDLVNHGIAKDLGEAVAMSTNGGNDMDMTGPYRDSLVSVIKAGKVKVADIDESVRRVLRIKFKLGLFDDPYKNSHLKEDNPTLLSSGHLQTAREIGRKSIVLLKNTNQLLPLSKDLKNIAVIGPLADSKGDMLCTWSAEGDSKKAITLLEGIKAAVLLITQVLYAKGCDILSDSTNMFNDAISAAQKSDVIIVAIGEAGNMSGEAHSRGDLNIPGRQEDLVKELLKTGKPIVVVLMNGRPLTINWLAANVPSLLETWFLGTQAGHSIADVIFGKYNPGGKLPVSFPYTVGQIPVFYNYKNTGHPKVNETNLYSSRYNDIPNEPTFPFCFVLSYTTFKYS